MNRSGKQHKNKGFTLVELIIVVAVIAVLAAVMAPQYLQYVERARQSNDLQLATNIIKAATIAAADPKSDLPAGRFVEILWITGEESGAEVTRGSLMIRHNDGYRVSIFNNDDGVDEALPTSGDLSTLEAFATNVFGVLGGADERISDYPAWLQIVFQDAESENANRSNFAVHIHTSTGQVALAGYPGASGTEADPNRWIEDIGLQAIPVP